MGNSRERRKEITLRPGEYQVGPDDLSPHVGAIKDAADNSVSAVKSTAHSLGRPDLAQGLSSRSGRMADLDFPRLVALAQFLNGYQGELKDSADFQLALARSAKKTADANTLDAIAEGIQGTAGLFNAFVDAAVKGAPHIPGTSIVWGLPGSSKTIVRRQGEVLGQEPVLFPQVYADLMGRIKILVNNFAEAAVNGLKNSTAIGKDAGALLALKDQLETIALTQAQAVIDAQREWQAHGAATANGLSRGINSALQDTSLNEASRGLVRSGNNLSLAEVRLATSQTSHFQTTAALVPASATQVAAARAAALAVRQFGLSTTLGSMVHGNWLMAHLAWLRAAGQMQEDTLSGVIGEQAKLMTGFDDQLAEVRSQRGRLRG